MNRLMTCLALGLVVGLAPAVAQDQPPADTQSPPAASEQPASPDATPSDPAEPIPGDTSQAEPDPAMPPAAQAPTDPASPPSAAEAPQPIEPAAPKSAEAGGMQFLDKQQTSDYLASNLIGESVYNAQDEVIGDINDLISDESGKFVAVLIGAGGFLGMGEKDVALRFEDLKFTRDENNDIKIVSNVSEEMLASAPDYERLSEQDVTVGTTDRGAEQ